MSFSIQQKLFFLLSGLTIVVLIIVLLAVNSTATSTIRQEVLTNFKQTQGFFQIEQNLRYDRLVESAYLIQENSTFKANVQINDPATVQQVVRQFALFIKADLFVVTNQTGEVLSWLGDSLKTGINLKESRATVRDAINGEEPPLNVLWPDLWAVGDMLFQVVTVPMYYGNSLLGTITLGTEFTNADAMELKQNTPLEITFFLDNEPIATSGDSTGATKHSEVISNNKSLIDSVLIQRVISEPFTYTMNDKEQFSFISPLGKGEPALYLASVSADEELAILSKMQRSILIIAGVAVLIILPLAIFLGRFFSKPVNRLTAAMSRVEMGEFDVSVTSSSDDEIGRMTKSFNNMVVGLKERFALQKYVGSHTLQMIQSSTEKEVKLGGRKTELTILFSDIRGSTVTIEENDPEVFVQELNKLLSFQSEIVVKHEGSIDKYVGDSIIALFSGKKAIEKAVACAAEMQQQFKDNSKTKDPFFKGLGIGVNYGTVVLGNMGGERRMDYTVIGPEVNLCARLCDAAEPGQILIPAYLTKNIILKKPLKIGKSVHKELKGFSKEVTVVEIIYG